ncbi:hypothetical protein [Endozoicomonas sp. ALB091]|uniref:hypothetical protein n=1 Tax=Endozoicomonas sp. ALB091 TaxID=3403073 RepID=UPI003BB7B101
MWECAFRLDDEERRFDWWTFDLSGLFLQHRNEVEALKDQRVFQMAASLEGS